MKKKLLITSALPYANGDLHLGHMVEYIQTDIWVRFQKLMGHDCLYVCGNDSHGTPIMLKAKELGITPEALIEQYYQLHQLDFRDFLIEFDEFYTTHSPENQQLANDFYQKLSEEGDILRRNIQQMYDEQAGMFLPDRFVKGECPRCRAKDQYGDSCEACGATYNPTDLIEPYSSITQTRPIEKTTEHLFFNLPRYHDFLHDWLANPNLQTAVKHKLSEWLDSGLHEWDISRDPPYFGFPIPSEDPEKFFYVWLDAPMGYMASFKHLCAQRPEIRFEDYWNKDSDVELYHFVGKDIIYFHALFWPAILKSANYRLPNGVFAHGFLTIDGKKMSKSRGTFITARHYLKNAKPEYLRYYFAAKLTSEVEDLDLSWDDFKMRVNADLVGKIINIASRCAGFLKKQFENRLASELLLPELYQRFVKQGKLIADYYHTRHYAKAVREITALADQANQIIDEYKPWKLIKQTETLAQTHAVCSLGIHLFRILILYLQPILPELAKKVGLFLNDSITHWQQIETPLLNHKIEPFQPLLQRIDDDTLVSLKDAPTQH